MQSANDEVHKIMMETAALPDHLHIITSQTLINSFPFFWLKIVIFMPLIFKMKEWKYSGIVLQDEIIYYDFLCGFGHSFSVVQGTNLLHVPFTELSLALNIGYS